MTGRGGRAFIITRKRSGSLDERHGEHHGSRRRDRMTITATTRARAQRRQRRNARISILTVSVVSSSS
jgi:hypothetical protein